MKKITIVPKNQQQLTKFFCRKENDVNGLSINECIVSAPNVDRNESTKLVEEMVCAVISSENLTTTENVPGKIVLLQFGQRCIHH